ncbi:MAG: type II secretion system protein [Kiritimatiellae bacterium]|nr:type II secretion system protein [Kiritimatiellia bacterium]
MRRGFTLVELMVVIGIMAIMGSLTVAGYRQMKRGMEERSVIQNVNEFLNGALQRAQIDRQNVAVYFWNETIKDGGSGDFEVVVGKAVAVRLAGRISKCDGNDLYDEFGDLEFRNDDFVRELDEFNEGGDSGGLNSSTSSSNNDKSSCINLYKMSGEGKLNKYIVYETTKNIPEFTIDFVHGIHNGDKPKIKWCYAFTVKEGEGSSSDWKAGDAYGFEFADITLPHGYIFGDNYSTNQDEPIEALDDKTLDIRPDDTTTNGIEIKSLRPRGKQLEKVMVGVARPNKK